MAYEHTQSVSVHTYIIKQTRVGPHHRQGRVIQLETSIDIDSLLFFSLLFNFPLFLLFFARQTCKVIACYNCVIKLHLGANSK